MHDSNRLELGRAQPLHSPLRQGVTAWSTFKPNETRE